MTETEAFAISKLAYACWPHIEISEEIVYAFRLALAPYPVSETKKALELCLRDPERQFPPTPPEIVRKIDFCRRATREAEARRFGAERRKREEAEAVSAEKAAAEIANLKAKFPKLFS